MTKKAPRKSTSYPQEFWPLSNHVIATGEPVHINTLGPRPEAYTTLTARYNEWRKAVERERGESDPVVQDLYSLSMSLTFDRSTKKLHDGQSEHKAVLRRREEGLSRGLQGLVAALPSASVSAPTPASTLGAAQESAAAANTISNLYGGGDDE